jgi:hypothetical protein
MTDGKDTRPGPAGFNHGLLSQYAVQTKEIIQELFEEENSKKYRDAYLKLALSGTTGALEALGKQQDGETSKDADPVDMTRFLADAWLSSMANAWDATRDLSRLWQNDFSRYVEAGTKKAEASSGQDDDQGSDQADNPPPVPSDNPGTGTEDRKDEPGKWS